MYNIKFIILFIIIILFLYQTKETKEIKENFKLYKPRHKKYKKRNLDKEIYIRDNNVLYDRLYPPLGRVERPTFDMLINNTNNMFSDNMTNDEYLNTMPFNIDTRGSYDTFRILGYLTPINDKQTLDSTLILFGRSQYRNSDIGEFYVSSSNKLSDLKFPLDNNNSNIKRITDIPNIVIIKGNILNGNYNFTELPKSNLTYKYL
jgi:hypothetical protein